MDISTAAIGTLTLIQLIIIFIGIDIGSSKAVLAAVRKGGIDIINSDTTNKYTPYVPTFILLPLFL